MNGAAGTEYRLLGPVQVMRDGQAVRLGPPKARALLGFLVLNAGSVVPAARLVEVLWDERPPVSARHALQVYVAGLRAALEPGRLPGARPEVLRTRPPGYELVVAADQVDVLRFESLVGQGRRQLAAGRAERAAALLRAAAALWRGPALADLGGLAFAEPVAHRLEELRLGALEERVDAELLLGRHAELAGELAGLVREHPSRERLRGQLMIALYRCGRQSDALRTFRELREHLAEEGLTPSGRLRELELAVLRHAPQLAAPALPGLDQPTLQLPAPAPAAGSPAPAPAPLAWTVTAVHVAVDLPAAGADDDLSTVLAEVPDRLARCLEAVGGTVTRRATAGVGAVFGLPQPHEDDPERAVRSALDAVREVSEFGRRIAESWPVEPPAVRVAVHTAAPSGDAAAAAARTAAAAAPGTVRVDAATRGLVEAQFGWVARHRDGTSEAGTPVAGPGRIRGLPGGPVPLVGRDREMAAGRAVVEAARAGNGRVLWITGEVGVGKTRLLAELRAQACGGDRPARWLQGHCLSYGQGLANRPIRELVHDWLGLPVQAPWLRLRARLRTRLDALLGPDCRDVRIGLASLLDLRPDHELAERAGRLTPEGMQRVATAAIRTVLVRLAEHAPLIVAVEDAHWADASSLRLLETLLDCAEHDGVTLLVTQRPERDHPSWRLRELAQRSFGHRTGEIVLGPLAAGEDAALLAALTGAQPVEPGLERRLLAAAEGNPFFIEELVRSLTEDGRARGGVEIPATVEQVLGSRIARLPADAQLLLATAAVLGRRFFADDAAEVAGLDAVPSAVVRELTGHGLLVQTRGRPAAEYEFRHALTHEAAYRSLWPARRRELHRRAAQVLAAQRAHRPPADEGALARHWQQAGDDERAMHSHRIAARAAFTVHALDVAEHHFTEGLAAAARLGERADHRDRNDLLLGLAQAGRLSGRGDPEARLAEALDAAVATDDRAVEWRARYELGYWLGYGSGRPREARSCFELAAAAAQRCGETAGRVTALSKVSLLLANELDLVGALDQADLALRIATDLDDERALADALDARKLATLYLGDLAAFDALLPRLEGILRRHDDLWTLQFVLAEAAVAAAAAGRWPDADARLREADEMNRRCGDRVCRPLILTTCTRLDRGRGAYGAALRSGAEAVAMHGSWWDQWARTDLGATLLECHDLPGAVEQLAAAAAQPMAPAQQVRSVAQLALARWRAGSRGAATRDLEAAEALLDGITAPMGTTFLFGADAALACAEVRLAAGEPARAEALIDPVLAAAEGSGWWEPLARALLVAARCRCLLDGPGRARALATRSLEVAQRAGLPAVSWRAHAVLAGVSAPDAEALLRRARRGVVELSAGLPDTASRAGFVDAALAEVDELAGPGR